MWLTMGSDQIYHANVTSALIPETVVSNINRNVDKPWNKLRIELILRLYAKQTRTLDVRG